MHIAREEIAMAIGIHMRNELAVVGQKQVVDLCLNRICYVCFFSLMFRINLSSIRICKNHTE